MLLLGVLACNNDRSNLNANKSVTINGFSMEYLDLLEIYDDGFLEIEINREVFKKDVEKSGISQILSISQLKQDSEQDRNHKKSKRIIQTVRSSLNECIQKNEMIISRLNNSFDSIEKLDKCDPANIKSLRSRLNKGINFFRGSHTNDSATLAIIDKILEATNEDCAYKIIDNKVKFYDQSCIFLYNELLMDLQLLITEAKIKELESVLDN